MARHGDFTGGDGEGDIYVRTLAVLDREGRFAVEGGVAVLGLYQLFVIRVDGHGVGFGVGEDSFLFTAAEVPCLLCLRKLSRIEFPVHHGLIFAKDRGADACRQSILDRAGVQAGDDGFRDGCKSSVQCIRISSIVSKLLGRTSLGLRSDFLIQIFANTYLLISVLVIIIYLVITCTEANGIERSARFQRSRRTFCCLVCFFVAGFSVVTKIIICLANRNITAFTKPALLGTQIICRFAVR